MNSNTRSYAWLIVALLVPVALLNYLDRQMLATMKFPVMGDITDIQSEANWGRMLGQFKWVYAFLSPIGGYLADAPSLGWGFFDCNNMPILCQVARPELRATGYGIMNLVSISAGGLADFGFGVLRDRQVPLAGIFSIFASAALISVVLVLLIRPCQDLETNS